MAPLTLMAVHAHPDDESSSTGGVLARYSSEGVRCVVVTCTDGEYGDAPGKIKPGQDGHDTKSVAAVRQAELTKALDILGVEHRHPLHYHDSGMPDWNFKEQEQAFCNVPLEEVSAKLADLMEEYRPDVLITYDEDGGYMHPDHLHAARAALAAGKATGIPRKTYLTAHKASDWKKLFDALKAAGVDVPDWGSQDPDPDREEKMKIAEARVTTSVDVSAQLAKKRAALAAHASQLDGTWFSSIPDEVAKFAFTKEHFILLRSQGTHPTPEDDLFAGLE